MDWEEGHKAPAEAEWGRVLSWDYKGGFGWIRPDSGKADVFVHSIDVVDGDVLFQGSPVEFETAEGYRTFNPGYVEPADPWERVAPYGAIARRATADRVGRYVDQHGGTSKGYCFLCERTHWTPKKAYPVPPWAEVKGVPSRGGA